MKRFWIIPVLFLLSLSGCAEAELASHVAKNMSGPSASQGDFKVGNPYKVEGKWYEPTETYSLVETGIASWYGPNFHGKKTANGETFNKYELTAAHRTLQMPSLVRVTNLENGRSVIVRVNDRGPFKRGRVMDVSEKAAELLKFKNKGTAKVRLEVLGPESRAIAEAAKRGEDTRGYEVAMNENARNNGYQRAGYNVASQREPIQTVAVDREPLAQQHPSVQGHDLGGKFYPDPVVKTLPVTPSTIYVQAGSFSSLENANHLAETLGRFGDARVYPAVVNGQQFYRVRIASASVENADAVLSKMAGSGVNNAIIVVD